jgi:hypothetical protein
MDKLDLSAGKSALGSIKEAKNLGKEFGGMITDEQAENERLIQAQHKKRVEEKERAMKWAEFAEFRAVKEYEKQKQREEELAKLKKSVTDKYGNAAWAEVEKIKEKQNQEHDEEKALIDDDRHKINDLMWWCVTVAALITYFFKLYKI